MLVHFTTHLPLEVEPPHKNEPERIHRARRTSRRNSSWTMTSLTSSDGRRSKGRQSTGLLRGDQGPTFEESPQGAPAQEGSGRTSTKAYPIGPRKRTRTAKRPATTSFRFKSGPNKKGKRRFPIVEAQGEKTDVLVPWRLQAAAVKTYVKPYYMGSTGQGWRDALHPGRPGGRTGWRRRCRIRTQASVPLRVAGPTTVRTPTTWMTTTTPTMRTMRSRRLP